jgi:hypothetical protein
MENSSVGCSASRTPRRVKGKDDEGEEEEEEGEGEEEVRVAWRMAQCVGGRSRESVIERELEDRGWSSLS